MLISHAAGGRFNNQFADYECSWMDLASDLIRHDQRSKRLTALKQVDDQRDRIDQCGLLYANYILMDIIIQSCSNSQSIPIC